MGLWLWRPLAMAAPGYGGPSPLQLLLLLLPLVGAWNTAIILSYMVQSPPQRHRHRHRHTVWLTPSSLPAAPVWVAILSLSMLRQKTFSSCSAGVQVYRLPRSPIGWLSTPNKCGISTSRTFTILHVCHRQTQRDRQTDLCPWQTLRSACPCCVYW